MGFTEKYGQWAFVAGGSEGMGGEFCNRLAKEGMNVVVTGRKLDKIEKKCRQLEADYGVKTLALPVDLGDLDAPEKVRAATEGLEVGFFVYNAGLAGMQPFANLELDFEMYRINVNVRSMLALTILFAQPMIERKKGGIILLSSYGGVVGTPYIQTYSATKAYGFTLAEALWAELSDFNIDVLGVLPGNTIGQSFSDVPPGTPGFQTGAEVVAEAFDALGKQPTVVTAAEANSQMAPYFNTAKRVEGVLMMKQTFIDMMAEYGETK